jgi:hypothetical protein
MGLNTATLNTAVDAAAALLVYASLHTAAPDGSGSNEVTGGSYARQAVTMGASSGAMASLGSTLTFSGPAGGAATYLGFWSASSGGTFRGFKALAGDQTFNAAGQYQVTSVTITGSSPT